VQALDACPEVEGIFGMARRPFDPASLGWQTRDVAGDGLRDAASA
jgi:hypothetical protein